MSWRWNWAVAALPDARKVFDQTISAMPPVDRDYWRAQLVNDFVRTEHTIYQRSVKARNTNEEAAYQKKLQRWQEKNGPVRTSRRLAVTVPGKPVAPTPSVSLTLARWVQDDEVVRKLHAKLTDPTHPPGTVSDWTPTELATLTPQQVRDIMFK